MNDCEIVKKYLLRAVKNLQYKLAQNKQEIKTRKFKRKVNIDTSENLPAFKMMRIGLVKLYTARIIELQNENKVFCREMKALGNYYKSF